MVDTAGNVGNTASQAVTIDTTAPTATVAITAIADDTGTPGDFITSDPTLTVSGSNSALGAGEKIQISSDGGLTWTDVTQATATTWSYVDPATHSTSFTYQTQVVDTAGNVGNTASQAVTIDTTAPTATVAITAIADDTGTPGDFITSDPTLTVSGSNSALGAGEKIQISSDGGLTWTDVTQATATTWSYVDPATHSTSFTYQTQVVDTAGNVGNTASQAVTIDTTAPTATVAITAIADDTGTPGDFITSDPTLTVSGSNSALGAGEKIQISSDGGLTWTDVTQATATTWSYVDPATHSTSFTYQTQVVDTAGNVGNTASQAVTIDTTAPTATVAITAIADDTGTPGDFITSDPTLTVSGSNSALGAGEKIQISSDGGLTWTDVTQATATTWSYVDPATHSTSFTYQTQVVDTAGNVGNTASQAVTIDTTAPTATVAITAIADDTGTPGDFITSDPTLTVSGSNSALGAGEKIQISSDGGLTWTDVTQATATTWSYVDPATHSTSFTYQTQVVDTAGNVGNTASQAVTIDTTAPTATVAITAIADDTGTPGDFITSDPTLTVSGSNSALGAGEKIQISSDGGLTWTDVTQATATTWSYVDPATHSTSFTYQTQVVDTAGNVGNTASQAVTIDTTAPTATVAITAIADDTGTPGDFITSDPTLTVSGSNSALGAGEKIQISSDGGLTWTDVTQATATTWSYVDPATHSTSFTYQTQVVDTAGNVGNTASQAVTIDTTAPTATVAITAIADDTGTPGDFITSDPTLTVSGSNSALGAGEKIQISSDGGLTWTDVTQATATTWSYVDPATHSTSFTYQTQVVDTAGNVGNTASQAVTIDTTAPTATVAITAIADDTGTPGDFITSDPTLTVSGSNSALGAGEKIQISSDGGLTWTDVTQATATTWSYVDPATHSTSFTYQTQVVDTAGNVGNTASQAVTIDTTAPTATVAITAIADDTGTPGDFITSDPTLTVSGSNSALGAGEKIQISSDGGLTWTDVTQATATTWSYVDPATHSTSFTYQTQVVDTAGNVGNTASQAVTIDTTAPTATVAITAIADDTGTPGDFITSDPTLTVSGSNSALGAGEKIQISSDGGLTWTDVTQATATTWSYVDPATHSTSFTYQTQVVDTAGNVGNTASQAVTIDTTAPTATVAITAIADDTGTPGDFITSDPTLTVSGSNSALGAGEKIQISSDGGLTWTDVTQATATTWSYVDPATHSTSFTYQTQVVDTAGNVGNTASQAVTIDTTAPTATVAITAIADDTGTPGDFITSDPTLTVSGSNSALGAGEKIQISSDGGLTWTDVTQATATTWSYVDPATHSTSFTYQTQVVDTAGNVGNTASQAVTIDTTAPTATVAITAIADDTGTPGDFITSDPTLTVSGSNSALGAGEKIQISSDGGLTWTDVTQATATTWSYVDPATHSTSFTYQTQVVDTAGNVGNTASQAVTIDTTAPTATVAITAIADDTGTPGDFITSDPTLTVSGSNSALGAGEKIQISSDGGLTWTDVTQATATTWSYVDPATHSTSFTYQTQVVDTAGNVGNTASQAVTIDTTAPTATVAITAIADDTGTPGDFITSDPTLTVSGSNSALGAGEKIQISSDGGLTWTDVTQATATTWSYVDPATHSTSFTYQTQVVDTAGNVGNTASQAVTIDTTAPTATVAITAIADDTGTPGDFITSDPTLTVSGSNSALGAGEKIQISSDGGLTWTDVTQATATTWSYVDPATHSTSFTYQTQVVDTAGNVGNTASQAVTITATDITPPDPPVITSVSDNVDPVQVTFTNPTATNATNDDTPTLTITAEAGSTVTVSNQFGPLGQAIETPIAGTFIFTVPFDSLSNDTYQFTATATDAANNTSDPSAPFSITVDTVADAAPTASVTFNDTLAEDSFINNSEKTRSRLHGCGGRSRRHSDGDLLRRHQQRGADRRDQYH